MKIEELIIEHMDIWTSAQMPKANGGRGRASSSNGQSHYGIKKLRELILELAVRGKLVPQDPKDEPASVLLEKIAKEKKRLIKEGKIKKQKLFPEIMDDEKPYKLPEGWEWARLQDVSKYIQRGKGPKYAGQGKVQVISQKSIQWAGFDLSQARFVDDNSLNAYQPERFLECNDLLWNSTGTGTVGRINVLREVKPKTFVADSHVTVIRLLQISSDFLWCYIAAPGIQIRIEPEHENSLVSGTTNQVELNTAAVQPLLVPLPPLSEQHRIVTKVNELMTLCDQLEQQQTNSNEAHQTLVETLLATLTNTVDSEEFAKAWRRIADHFDNLFTTEKSIDHLKQTILQLAVMGQLVPQESMDLPEPKPGKYFVYALECEDKSIYIGQTDDVLERWKEHAAGKGSDWTKQHPPVRLVHWEEYNSREEAAKREKELKTDSGGKWLKREIAAGRTRQANEPACLLLEKIEKEKKRLIKEGKIKKQKPTIGFRGLDELKVSLPSRWLWIRLNDIADVVRGGSPRPAGDPRYYDGNIPFLKVADVTRVEGKMVQDFNYTIKEAGLKKTRLIRERTVLLTNSGATLGIPAICDFEATFNDGIAAFVELSQFVFDEYLHLYLKSLSKWFIDIASRGQGQPNLNTDIIKATWFALPPLTEQHRIVGEVDKLMTLCDKLKAQLTKAQTTQCQLPEVIMEQVMQ